MTRPAPAPPESRQQQPPTPWVEAIEGLTALVGNLTADLDLRFSQTGTAYARGRIAVQQPKTPGDWKGEKATTYHDLTCFGTVAEHAAQALHKGTRVVAVGKAEVQHWTDNDGHLRQTRRIVCDELSPSLRWANATVTRSHRS